MLTKDEIKVRVLKLKNELIHEQEPVMYKDLAHKYLNKVLDILMSIELIMKPWIFEGTPFYLRILTITSVLSISLQISRTIASTSVENTFGSSELKGKKRKVKSESDWKNYYGSCPELKEDRERMGRQNFSRTILSVHKTSGKTNFEETRLFVNGVPPRPLTAESQDTTMETSSTDISEKTTMKETVDIVNHIREWAVDQVESKDDFDEIADRFALIEEYKEWFNLEDDLEIVSLDQIKEDEYNDFVDYMNDGMERG